MAGAVRELQLDDEIDHPGLRHAYAQAGALLELADFALARRHLELAEKARRRSESRADALAT